jgi:2,4-dienoyl-CoA reductase-like NADH-dependent reductase (Old Yellow Enzyme family)
LWQLFSDRAVESWAPIVKAVHEHGAKMFVQLMHGGHHADHFGQFGGPLSASTVPPIEGHVFRDAVCTAVGSGA